MPTSIAGCGWASRRLATADERAWREIVDRYSGVVRAVTRAHRLSPADAADVTQTTWLRLLEHLPALRDPECIGGWLTTTARRECLRVIRHGARCRPCDEPPEPPARHWDDHAAELIAAERDETLRRAFARLPQRDQALLRLLTAEPAPSYQEIGAELDMPIGSIGPTRARSLVRLHRELRREGTAAAA